MKSNDIYRPARQRENEIKGFYSHLATYSGVMGLLFLVDLITGGFWWFYWPLCGWGMGIVAHAVDVYGRNWLDSEGEKKRS